MYALNFIGYFHNTENPADVIKHTYAVYNKRSKDTVAGYKDAT